MATIRANDGGCLLNADQFEYTKDELGRPVLNTKSGSGGNVTSVNGKTGAITLSASDVGAVPTTRTVAGHALSTNVTLVKGDVGLGNVDNTSDANKPVSTATKAALDDKVPTTRKVNGKALSTDITLTASDVGALASTAIAVPAFTADDNGKVLGVVDGALAWVSKT